MTSLRPYRNGDTPALADLWNRAALGPLAVRPLDLHEFDALAIGKLGFDRNGLIVAERDGRVVGYAHAGFGPGDPTGDLQRPETSLGCTAMLIVDSKLPKAETDPIADLLLGAAEGYLRDRGADVLYCGGQFPLNPFYWGLYGGGEFSGVLDSHLAMAAAARRAGYLEAARTTLLELALDEGEIRDPALIALKRTHRIEVEEDAVPATWWDAIAIGPFAPSRFLVVEKSSGDRVAEAWTWELAAGFAMLDGRVRTGLFRLEVRPEHRQRGLGRFLVVGCMKQARAAGSDAMVAQTSAENEPALALYDGLGFDPIGAATLYRRPGDL